MMMMMMMIWKYVTGTAERLSSVPRRVHILRRRICQLWNVHCTYLLQTTMSPLPAGPRMRESVLLGLLPDRQRGQPAGLSSLPPGVYGLYRTFAFPLQPVSLTHCLPKELYLRQAYVQRWTHQLSRARGKILIIIIS